MDPTALLAEYLAIGEEPPPGLIPPDLEPGADTYLEAWNALAYDRPLGQGFIGSIPFMTIDRYAERIGLTGPDEFARFARLVRAMDAEYVAIVNAKMRDV